MRTKLTAIGVILAASITGCVPSPPTPTSEMNPSAAQTADMCARLETVLAEWVALGDAFDLVIAGDLEAAAAQARLIRARLDDLVDGLRPSIAIRPAQSELGDAVESWAGLIGSTAETIVDPTGVISDRDVILAEGRVLVRILDRTLGSVADDPISEPCPQVESTVGPVDFPPPPTNAELGIPDTIGELVLEPHVGRPHVSLAEALESVDVNPRMVRLIRVDVTEQSLEPGWALLDVLDHVNAPTAALAAALQEAELRDAVATNTELVGGFTVFTYERSGDEPSSLHIAVRDERVVILYDFPDPVVRAILEAMPDGSVIPG